MIKIGLEKTAIFLRPLLLVNLTPALMGSVPKMAKIITVSAIKNGPGKIAKISTLVL